MRAFDWYRNQWPWRGQGDYSEIRRPWIHSCS